MDYLPKIPKSLNTGSDEILVFIQSMNHFSNHWMIGLFHPIHILTIGCSFQNRFFIFECIEDFIN